ncbi:MAG: amidohydrolase [Deltaproteobacteria bacterium]|nr:amidohydrolase [Deltaproteobacteria bacterium]
MVLVGATIMTATGAVHAPGWVTVEDGRITGVGAGEPPAALAGGATRVEAAGRFVTPGLIDVHSHLGVYPSPGIAATRDGNEASSPNTAGVWAEHSFWAEDPGIERAARGGVTTIHVLPGSANLVGGRGVTLHLRPMRGARAMRFPEAPDSLKMACGENPKRVYGGKGGAPSTRMGSVRGHREAFIAAKKWLAEHKDKPLDQLPRDLAMETLAGVLEGRILPQVHCYTAQDILGFLQIADEAGFQVRAFHHALEAYKVRDILAARDIGVATWADWWGFKLEGWDGIPEGAALGAESGVRVAIHSDSPEGIQRLNQEAAKALASGRAAGIRVDEHEALRWITANPAWMLGIEDEVGTLEVGKRADLVVWDKHPFSVYARAERVWIDGVEVVGPSAPDAPWSDFELGKPGGAR